MMKSAKYFDIHDKDVTPEIYTLLFCDAFVALTGNDTYYRIRPFGDEDGYSKEWENYPATKYTPSSEEQFKERLKRGYRNCYHDEQKMKYLVENPCSCEFALSHFKKWLLDKGVTKEDALFVKIWW